ncbi:MAG TPA: response regulator [Verrucomicrobiae bacterium]|nr:response regulator [Verrucomicrobiae bacterium]
MNDNFVSSPVYTLAIDDEPEILDVIRQTLEGEGLPVLTAAGARDGLETYERRWREIGVVLLDYLMPEMTGDLVLECILHINPDARVLLLTGCDDRVARAMFDAGVRGCIQKPFYLDDLVQRVRDELSQV